MRLLSTEDLKFHEVADDEIPPYAILSHTWGSNEEEVSFQRMQQVLALNLDFSSNRNIGSHRILNSPGFKKILASARLAKSQGFEYIWIDTCCIDKTSSAELSEAINSMFHWYRSSAICYALLSDVEDNAGHSLTPDIAPLRHQIENSRWFTRGWTLQELVAPSEVYFYSKNWALLGSKCGTAPGIVAEIRFPKLVCQITGIETDILCGSRSLYSLSVAKRMSLAANRVTKRSEDMAYCLLGLFGIRHMPIIYGLGKEAFIRLQEEILKITDDQSLFAWENVESEATLSGLLAPSPRCFQRMHDVVPLPHGPTYPLAPWEMTNVGLHVQLHLRKLDAEVYPRRRRDVYDQQYKGYYVVLKCYPREEKKRDRLSLHNFAIQLVHLHSGQYARLHSQKLFLLPFSDKTTHPHDETRYVYVKQKPVYDIPRIVVTTQNPEENKPHRHLIISSAYPSQGWDSATKTVKPDFPDDNGVLAAFRCYQAVPDACFDIYVGVSYVRNDPTYWCSLQNTSRYKKLHPSNYVKGSMAMEYSEKPETSATVKVLQQSQGSYISLHLSPYAFCHRSIKKARVAGLPLNIALAARVDTVLTDMAMELTTPETWHSVRNIFTRDTSWHDNRQIRTITRGNSSSSTILQPGQQTLCIRHLVDGVVQSDLVMENSDGTPDHDTAKSYFRWLFVRACIEDDAKMATDFLESPIGASLLETRTSINPDKRKDGHDLLLGFRPLHWAIVRGNIGIVRLLLRYGVDIDSRADSGLTAFHLAALTPRLDVLHELIDGLDQAALTRTFQMSSGLVRAMAVIAVSYVQTKDVRDILMALSTVDERTLAGTARSTEDDTENRHGRESSGIQKSGAFSAKFSLQTRERTGNWGRYGDLICRAAAMNNIEAVRFLAERRQDGTMDRPYLFERTPLWHAAAVGAVTIINILLQHIPSDSTNRGDRARMTPLHAACRGGHEEAVKTLIQAGADVGLPAKSDFTACHFAALSGNASVLRILLEHGADPDKGLCCDDQEIALTPLHIAAANGFLECVRVLVEAGCNTEKPTAYLVLVDKSYKGGVQVTEFADLPVYRAPIELARMGYHYSVGLYLSQHGNR